MLDEYRVYDADAHVMLSPKMWESLPAEFAVRRPRPIRVGDSTDMGFWNTGWLIEGRMEPHPMGPGAQPANTPGIVLEEFGASTSKMRYSPESRPTVGSMELSDPSARLRDLDQLGIDVQMLFPSTLFAHMTADPGFEAALYRSYNRYMAGQCKADPRRLKWAALLPMGNTAEAHKAIEEMVDLGASAGVVYGTVGDRLHSHPSFAPAWAEFARTGLPLCVHMGMSYPPFQSVCESIFDAHVLGMCIPAQLAFVALVGHGMMDRYPDLRVVFLEFGGEWILYMVSRMDHYLPGDRNRNTMVKEKIPRSRVEDYVKSGRIFVGMEGDDPLMTREMELMGESQFLYSSDFPHAEARDNAAKQILARDDLTAPQKRRLFYDNAVRLYGEP